MTIRLITDVNYVIDTSSGDIITFEDKDLTPRQFDVYQGLPESDRFGYILAILNGDPTSQWEDN